MQPLEINFSIKNITGKYLNEVHLKNECFGTVLHDRMTTVKTLARTP